MEKEKLIREELIRYDMVRYKVLASTDEQQRMWSEQNVDEYLKEEASNGQ